MTCKYESHQRYELEYTFGKRSEKAAYLKVGELGEYLLPWLLAVPIPVPACAYRGDTTSP